MHAGRREPATAPEQLGRLFLQRANAGDVDGVVALYAADAVLRTPDGATRTGAGAIRRFYAELLGPGRPAFAGEARPALVCGELALTSTRLQAGVSAEVARRQGDGTWLWVIDDPNLARPPGDRPPTAPPGARIG